MQGGTHSSIEPTSGTIIGAPDNSDALAGEVPPGGHFAFYGHRYRGYGVNIILSMSDPKVQLGVAGNEDHLSNVAMDTDAFRSLDWLVGTCS